MLVLNYLNGKSLRGVVAKVLDYGIVIMRVRIYIYIL